MDNKNSLDTDEARQGRRITGMPLVLGVSVAAGVVAMVVLLSFFV